MVSPEINEKLTRVGPGTPGGELLRRYWHPVAPAIELSDSQPTRFLRILGEDLVLFRDKSGGVGLIADRCAHRGASLCYGRVEERGIACPYHGWLYNIEGRVLETPPEKNQAIVNHVRQPAYRVRKFVGIYWAYLGPDPAPEIPRLDLLVRQDGVRRIRVLPTIDCNWLQTMENSVDPAHLQILHQELIGRGRTPVSTTRGFIDDVTESDFEVTSYGIDKRRIYADGQVEAHPLIFPNGLRQGNGLQIRVPIDDTHTSHIRVYFDPVEGESGGDQDPSIGYEPPYKNPPDQCHPFTRFRWDVVAAQDHMAWETQGAIADRSNEHLSYSDRGVVLFRRLLLENMERVARGEDPLGIIRNLDQPVIDTHLDETLRQMQGRLGRRSAERA